MAAAPLEERWTGEDVTAAEIERELARLRAAPAGGRALDLRTRVLTHTAWVPEEWLEAATATLAGLGERHPSRTILLVPDPGSPETLRAELSVRRFPLPGRRGHVSTEVIQLRLGGSLSRAPASLVLPLLISDLPVFLRWRGEPPFGAAELEQLVGVCDRLVVDSSEWRGLPGAYRPFSRLFARTACSDLAWSRTLGRRASLAALWPGIAGLGELRVTGPQADALLLAGWLRARLARHVALVHEEAPSVEGVWIDGEPVAPPPGGRPTPSELLSAELDTLDRDPVFEAAVGAACP